MSDLYDPNQSRLRVAHRHLSENDRLYRISLVVAPIALVAALTTGALSLVWRPAAPLPPPAVPVQPPAPSPPVPAQPSTPSPPAPAAQAVNLQELRDRATSDAAALEDLRTRASGGSAEAQFYLATLYDPLLPGIRFSKDAAAAVQWYELAAGQSYAMAENNLGLLYENGQGRPKDEAQAASWYRKSADQGVSLAQANLGRLYEFGFGVPKDATEAARWFERAAEQNNHYAENELGYLYLNGLGVPRDLDRGLALFRRAAAAGEPWAVYNLALSLDKGWGAPRSPMAAYIWYSIAAHAGDPSKKSEAAADRDRLAREIARDDLAAAQRAAENWRPGSHGRIGAALQDLTPADAQAIGSAQAKGAIITRIEDGSAAQRAGLTAQDVVTAVDGEPIANSTALRELIWLGVPGQTVVLWVEKSRQRGSLQNIRVQLDQAPR